MTIIIQELKASGQSLGSELGRKVIDWSGSAPQYRFQIPHWSLHKVCAVSRKGAGSCCFSGFSVLISLPQTQRKKETENISAGNAYCSLTKVGTDQNYEKNCRIQDGVGHRELVYQNSTIVTLSSLPSRTTKMAPTGPAQIQNFWKQQAALDTFCLYIYENQK